MERRLRREFVRMKNILAHAKNAKEAKELNIALRPLRPSREA